MRRAQVVGRRAPSSRVRHAFLEISLIFHLRIETILERKRQANGLEGPIYSYQNTLAFRCTQRQQGLRSSIIDDRHAACVGLRHQHSTPHYSAPHPQS